MKQLLFIFSIVFLISFSSMAQTFVSERQKDISKLEEQINLLESNYLSHNTKGLKKGKRVILRIIDREIKRTTEDITKMRHEVSTNPSSPKQLQIDLMVRKNRLTIMKYIQQRANEFDLSTVYELSDRELMGYKAGLIHFKTLMLNNYDPRTAIHRIPSNAKRISTPAKKKETTE